MFILNTNFSSDKNLINRLGSNELNQKNKNQKDPDLSLKDSISINQLAPGKGDLNGDGVVNLKDASILGDYLYPDPNNPPEKLTEDQLKKADANNDGKINYDDLTILYITSSNLITGSYKPGSSVKGDLNGDGKIDDNDLQILLETEYLTLGATLGTRPSDELVKAVDFNGDGILNNADLKILESLYTEKPDTLPKEKPPERPPNANVKIGDLNQDRIIDYTDLKILGDAINNKKLLDKLTEDQKQAADLNKDGKIDGLDLVELQKEIVANLHNSFNPSSGIAGDFNGDSIVDDKDLEIFNEKRESYHIAKNNPQYEPFTEYIKGFLDFNNDGGVTKADKDFFINKILHKPLPKIETPGEINNDSKNWMVSQHLGHTNPNVDKTTFNGNCAPTSLVMIARMFGKLGGGPEEAQKQIRYIRELAGTTHEYTPVSLESLSDAAESLGLKSTHTFGDINTIKSSLNSGKKLLLCVDPGEYAPGGGIGHAIVVSGFKDGMFEVYDPGNQRPIKVSEKALAQAMQISKGDMLIVGKS